MLVNTSLTQLNLRPNLFQHGDKWKISKMVVVNCSLTQLDICISPRIERFLLDPFAERNKHNVRLKSVPLL